MAKAGALGDDLPLVCLDQLLGDRQPEAGAAVAPRGDAFGLAECFELASEVAQYPPNHAQGRTTRDRYLTMCPDSR